METQIAVNKAEVEFRAFLKNTYEAWNAGRLNSIIGDAQEKASEKHFTDWYSLYSENEFLNLISSTVGFIENEILILVRYPTYVLTSKRLFISKQKVLFNKVDIINLNEIISVKRFGDLNKNGLISLTNDKDKPYKNISKFPQQETIDNIKKEFNDNTNFESFKSLFDQNLLVSDGEIAEKWECRFCKSINPIEINKCEKCEKLNTIIEIDLNNKKLEFNDLSAIELLIKGKKLNLSVNTPIRNKNGEDRKWYKFEEIAESTDLQKFITPVWSTATAAGFIGALIVIVLKGIDSSVMFFEVEPLYGFLFLGVIGGSLLSTKFKEASTVAFFSGGFLIFNTGVNVFFSFLAIVAIGFIFGYPAGMIVGSISAFSKQKNGKFIHDAPDEDKNVYLKSLLLPVIILAITIPLYFFWLNPLILDYLSK